MTFTVTNQRNQSEFDVAPGETILEGALRNNLIFPYGCRNGACGACKCKLIDGSVDYGQFESYALTEEEISSGQMLICQATPKENVVIDVEQIMAGQSIRIKTMPCRVAKLERVASDVMVLNLQLPNTQTFDYIPGQYLDIIMKDGQRRSFSIANLPEQSKQEGLELHVRLVQDGEFTPRVFESMRERDLLKFEGPFGTYFMQSEPGTPIIMIAGGTGFAPIKALIEQTLAANPDFSIHLFWGARDQQDLYLNDLPENWQSEYSNFSYTPVLSESKDDSWQGENGWVHEAVIRQYPDFTNYHVYASGPPVMIDAIRTEFGKRNLSTDRFFFDSFEYANS